MVSFKELKARTKQYFSFSKHELQGFLVSMLLVGFIFSFRDWGIGSFDVAYGMKNFVLTVVAAGLSIFGHIAGQKIYGLATGYLVSFKVWWTGLLVSLVLAFVSAGYLTLVLVGGISISFMVRHRLGQFRYGHSMEEQSIIGMWGVIGSLITATVFRVFDFFIPNILFLEKGIMISLIFAICSILPLPKMDGLTIFFGSRTNYFLSVVIALVGSLLILWGGGWGLLIGIVVGSVAGLTAILWGSEI